MRAPAHRRKDVCEREKTVLTLPLERKVNLCHVFAGLSVGVTPLGERVWLVTLMHYDLGYFDDEAGRVEPIGSLRLETVTYLLGINRHACVRGARALV